MYPRVHAHFETGVGLFYALMATHWMQGAKEGELAFSQVRRLRSGEGKPLEKGQL